MKDTTAEQQLPTKQQLLIDIEVRDRVIAKYSATISAQNKKLRKQAKKLKDLTKKLESKDRITQTRKHLVRKQIELLEEQETVIDLQTSRISSLIENIEYLNARNIPGKEEIWLSLLSISKSKNPKNVITDTVIYMEDYLKRFTNFDATTTTTKLLSPT